MKLRIPIMVMALMLAMAPALLIQPEAAACHADISITVECRDEAGVSTVGWSSTPDHSHWVVTIQARAEGGAWADVATFTPVSGVTVTGEFEWAEGSVQVRSVASNGGTRKTEMVDLVFCPTPSTTTTSTTTSTTQPPPTTTTTTSTTRPPATTTTTSTTQPPSTTTTSTTQPPATTTTTTTQPPVPSTTSTTSTTQPPDATTTTSSTLPPETTTTTTPEEATTTTTPETATTVIVDPPPKSPPTPELPFTDHLVFGVPLWPDLGILAIFVILFGSLLVVWAKPGDEL